MTRIGLAVLLSIAAGAAFAAPIYRCGQTYSQTPCPDGQLIDAADPRSAAQRAQAKRVVAQEKKLAAEMERDRRAQESAAAGSGASSLVIPAKPVERAVPKTVRSKKKPAKPKAASAPDFVALAPASQAKAKK